jgi:hypothetical protein
VEILKKFANEQYVGDYGMTIKYLVDKVLVEPQPYQHMFAVLEDHESRLAKLEGTPTEEKKFKIKKLNGRKIKIPIKEE